MPAIGDAAGDFGYLGRGVYSVMEAARYTHVGSQQIRRWLLGYTFRVDGEQRESPPVIDAAYEPIDNRVALSFLDLIEVRFVHAFRECGVSLHAVRIAARRARELLQQDHPFSTQRFRTDGRTIMAEVAEAEDEPELLDLVKNQMAFRKVLAPYLYKGLEFTPDDVAARWWPMARNGGIVLDPERALGQPILASVGVPTYAVAEAYQVERSLHAVASLFEIPLRLARSAVDFEERCAA